MNISEGRRADVLAELDAAAQPALLDRHSDPDHHRSVLTLAHHDPAVLANAVQSTALAAETLIDIDDHVGVHPRFGALDAVPFVALAPTPREEAVRAAHEFASWWSSRNVPVFLYDEADEARRSLPDARRDAFAFRPPDLGPTTPHPRLGATAVGARPPMIAVNCDLEGHDPELAKAIATRVRERDGGLPGVRALAFELVDGGCSQVSMNLVALDRTGMEAACTRVRELARVREADVMRVELVGLMPAAELERCSESFRAWAGIDESSTIEARVNARNP